jgi:hypothetical protein
MKNKKPAFIVCWLIMLFPLLSSCLPEEERAAHTRKDITNAKYGYTVGIPSTWEEAEENTLEDDSIDSLNIFYTGLSSIANLANEYYYYDKNDVTDRGVLKVSIFELQDAYKRLSIRELIALLREYPGNTLPEKIVFSKMNGIEYSTDIVKFTADDITMVSACTVYNGMIYSFIAIRSGATAPLIINSIKINGKINEENEAKKPGFFRGIWHGIRAPVVFIFNLFSKKDIIIFANPGTVGYKIGFVLGILVFLSTFFGGAKNRS